ncbi:hypothetical protein [Sciscionella sediminilitoris]|uniref:hypothetical protein n=1 Tax=Sciscionella sediminilitoris TaxID=1445613 RepID=UPI0004DFCC9B|nr:hypothetical protein [Sciscionella sp. SE31]
MPLHQKLTNEATDRRTGMTLDELATFVTRALHAGADGAEPVTVVAGMRGGIKQITVEVQQ